MTSASGRTLDCTGVQTAGMLDALYATDEPLGDCFCSTTNTRRLAVWVSAAREAGAVPCGAVGRRPSRARAVRLTAPRCAPLRLCKQAPTAQLVELLHWWEVRGGQPEVLPMQRNSKGVWSIQRPDGWMGT
jgi:hypothetical protein